MIFKYVLIAVLSYLIGSVNFSILVSRSLADTDIRTQGSGNAGLTNTYRVMGPKKAGLVLLGDACKGLLVTWGALWFAGELGGQLAMLFAVLGHVFPLYFDFRGGKGVLTTGACLAVLDGRVFLILLAVFLLTVLLTKYVSAGSLAAAVGTPVLMFLFRDELRYQIIPLLVGLLVVFMHRENIKRLLRGTESKFSFKQGTKKQHR